MIRRDGEFVIDRSLDASRFAAATGYRAPPWEEMIAIMHAYHLKGLDRHV
jgi:dTDP-4-dehydrorhamnose reductase